MKKSLMWMLTAVMAITFVALLYFQIMYLENMVKMREEQFTEGVMRSLNMTSEFLEKQETLYFLEQDVNIIESSLYDAYGDHADANLKYSVENPDGSVTKYTLSSEVESSKNNALSFPSPTQNIGTRYGIMQEVIRSQYLYQKGLLNEVILSILRDSSTRPIMERADSTMIRNCLTADLTNNGVNVPFAFLNPRNEMVYSTEGYVQEASDIYSIPIFTNTNSNYTLNVEFPTKNTYIFKSVRFIIPTLAFTVILLVIFVYTLILAFRQKNLAEMKTDFINNMTHELKTPISTISLAGQMLSDPSIRKSQSSLTHLSEVIVEESKRLRFQVEKVLQMSMFDKQKASLKLQEIDANLTVYNIVNTFKLKVEKYGGHISADLDAMNALVYVDEMHFTNVIFNLLDNAVKYRAEERPLNITVTSRDLSDERLEIVVSDNGIGIRRDDLKKIFDKFYRVSTGNLHDVKGFGLGLAYVKKMIGELGGAITVESEFNVGTKFIIILPLSKN